LLTSPFGRPFVGPPWNNGGSGKTHVILPQATIVESSTYYWRARYIDSSGAIWEWSPTRSFTAAENIMVDENHNSISNTDELPPGSEIDLDNDGRNDLEQDNMK
jgi:hypothetical protein